MSVLLDTGVIIAVERNSFDASLFEDITRSCISVLTWSELFVGVYSADTKKRADAKRRWLTDYLAGVPVLPFDLNVAEIHAKIAAELRKTGKNIGAHDLMIAATALFYDMPLLTLNKREFKRVSGLKLL